MKHEDEPLNDYNKRKKEYITDLVKHEIVALGEEKKTQPLLESIDVNFGFELLEL